MISLEKQIEILADFSLNYQDSLVEHGEWGDFFRINDLTLPFCSLLYLQLAAWHPDYKKASQMEILIRKTFYDLCDELQIERGRKHLSLPDMFRQSPNEDVYVVDDSILIENVEV